MKQWWVVERTCCSTHRLSMQIREPSNTAKHSLVPNNNNNLDSTEGVTCLGSLFLASLQVNCQALSAQHKVN